MARLFSRIVLAALVATALLSLTAHADQCTEGPTLNPCGVLNCVSCGANVPDRCVICQENFVWVDGNCIPHDSSMTQPTCTDPHCASCVTNANVCDVCREGYTVVDAKCLMCEGTATGASALWAATTTVVAVAVLATVA